jgi:hypothetical protein
VLHILTIVQDSDTNPNTTASSVAGDAPVDGRKRRAEEMNMRKSIYGKKHDRLGASKVRHLYKTDVFQATALM